MRFVPASLAPLFICLGCGTGPWFIAKKNYDVYTKPVVQTPLRGVTIKTTGSYVDERPLSESRWRTSLHFGANGDVLKTDSIIDGRGDLSVGSTQGWYTILGDSLFIEYFAPHRRQMYAMVYWHAGHALNDSTLRMAYTDQPQKIKKYVFVPGVVVLPKDPPLYAGKKWYRSGLHPSRR